MQRASPLGLLMAALLIAAPQGALAQGFVLKGGLSYGNVTSSGVLPGNLEGRNGFAAGIALGSERSLLGFGIEGLYAQRGVTSTTGTDERRLDYVDVPAYLRVMIPTPGVTPFAYAGPQVSFEVRCRSGGADCPASDRPSTAYAGVIGGGVRFGDRSGISVEGRYIYGLTDLNLGTVTSSNSYRTRSFLVLAGLAF